MPPGIGLQRKRRGRIMTRMTSLLATIAVAFTASTALVGTAFAQDKEHPERPAATEGTSSGEYGSQETGNPSESGTSENVQPGPGQEGPADPAAADNPAARIPTDKNE
jgi:hypothetical protein